MNRLKVPLAVLALAGLCALSIYSATHSIDVEQLRVAGAQILRGDDALYPAGIYEGGEVHPYGFSYAPALAFLFVPLALVPLPAAAFLIFWLDVAALVHIVVMVSRMLGVEREQRLKVGTLAFLATAGYMLEEFRGGNIHFLIVWLVVFAIDRLERGRTWPSAAALGLAIAAKLTPALFLLPLLLRGRFRVALATAGTLAGVLLAPAAIVGVAMNATLIEGFILFSRSKMTYASNESLRGLFIHLLTANPVIGQGALRVTLTAGEDARVNLLWLVAAGVVLLPLIWMMSRRVPSVEQRMLEYSAVTMAILLIAPHTQRIYFCSLFFPCAVFAALLVNSEVAHSRRLIQSGLLAAFSVSSLLPAILPGRRAAFAYERLWPHAFLTLGLLIVTVIACASRRREEDPGQQSV